MRECYENVMIIVLKRHYYLNCRVSGKKSIVNKISDLIGRRV